MLPPARSAPSSYVSSSLVSSSLVASMPPSSMLAHAMLASSPPVRRALLPNQRARGVTAALGPTNTGKTYLAIERMTAFSSGMIGLPLRLLAREVYGRVVEKMGVDKVALITGEEKKIGRASCRERV